MNDDKLKREILEALSSLPMIDVHTHLVDGHLGAKGLHDILLYHMSVSDLYAAGCPSGARLTEYPGWPDRAEAHQRLEEALPYLSYTRNTAFAWGMKFIFQDLYDWGEPIRADNWRNLDGRIRELANDRAWPRSILRRLNIKRVGTELARRENGTDDDIFQYALEWAFFTRVQWGEYDTALYELERCWGRSPESPTPIGAGRRAKPGRTIRSLDDVRAAMEHYVQAIPADRLLSLATHISTDLDLTPVSETEMAAALARRAEAGAKERSIYASYINELFLTMLESVAPHLVFQFSFGAEPLPNETMSRLSQRTIAQVGDMISRHPQLKFQCFLASQHANQSLCTMCRELPNLSLVGYWWHNFFPAMIKTVMEERLDMLPVNRQIGFFSDAYCVEWVYGKAMLMRSCLAEVLANKVQSGQYSTAEALDIAREILFESPQTLLGFEAANTL